MSNEDKEMQEWFKKQFKQEFTELFGSEKERAQILFTDIEEEEDFEAVAIEVEKE